MAFSFVFLLTSLLIILPAALGYGSKGNILRSEQQLNRNEYLEVGSCIFVVENNCDLALYDNYKNDAMYFFLFANPKWKYQIDANNYDDNCELLMQDDGNLVLYKNNDMQTVLWQSNTYNPDDHDNYGNYVFVLESDCTANIYGKPQKTVNS